ncbi:MAG: hypothetical protein ACKN9U_13055 [Pirellulaceae bacterium]
MDWFRAEFHLAIDGAGVTADLPFWMSPVVQSPDALAWNGTLPRWEVVQSASPLLNAVLAWPDMQDGWQ